MNDQSKVQDMSQGIRSTPMMQFDKYVTNKMKKSANKFKFDPFKSPPDFQEAVQHGIARRVCTDSQKLQDSFTNQNDEDKDEDKDEDTENNITVQEKNRVKSEDQIEVTKSIINRSDTPSDFICIVRPNMCPCCGNPVENQQISLCVDPREISHLGITYTLYFQFIKKCFLLILVQFFMSGAYNLILNNLGNACQLQQITNVVCQTSVINILKERNLYTLHIQSLANFMTIIVLIIVVEMFKINQEINRYTIEKYRLTPADFTIEVKGFHQDTGIDQVEDFIQHLLNGNNLNQQQTEICKIYFLLDMKPYSLLYKQKLSYHKERNILSAQLRDEKTKSRDFKYVQDINLKLSMLRQIFIFRISQMITEIEKSLDQFERIIQESTFRRRSLSSIVDLNKQESILVQQELLDKQNEQLKFSGRMLVTLNQSLHAKKIVQGFQKNWTEAIWYKMYKLGIFQKTAQNKLSKFFYKDNMIKSIQLFDQSLVRRASEPSDIIWQNIGSHQSNYKMRIIINISVISIFLVNLALLIYIKRALKKQTQLFQDSNLWMIAFSFLASTIVALTNTLIGNLIIKNQKGIILRKFAGLESYKRQTDYFVSVGKNLSYLYFINMVGTTLGSNMLSILKLPDYKGFPIDQEGLIYDFFFLFITNSYLSSIFNYFDIMWGFKLLRRRRETAKGNQSSLSQSEANQLFEGHPADMALRYANVCKLMFFSAAVCTFLPIGLLMSMIGLIILYWVDKYLLLRRYICPHYLDSQLADAMIDNLSLYTVFLSFGNITILLVPILQTTDQEISISEFVWPDFYSNPYFYIALFGLVLSLCYRYLVKLRVIRNIYYRLFSIRIPRKKINTTYQESKNQFKSDYENYHPVLREYYLPGLDQLQAQENRVIAPELFKDIIHRLH